MREWHRPAAASSREIPSCPSTPSKKMGICNSASPISCVLSAAADGVNIVCGTAVPIATRLRSSTPFSSGECRIGMCEGTDSTTKKRPSIPMKDKTLYKGMVSRFSRRKKYSSATRLLKHWDMYPSMRRVYSEILRVGKAYLGVILSPNYESSCGGILGDSED